MYRITLTKQEMILLIGACESQVRDLQSTMDALGAWGLIVDKWGDYIMLRHKLTFLSRPTIPTEGAVLSEE